MAESDELLTDEYLLLSTQRALLGEVTPPLRAVSVDLDTMMPEVRIRFTFEWEPSPSEREAASCATTMLIASYPAPWGIDEQYVVTPLSEPMEHLRLVAYHRCEDDWVSPYE